VCNFALASSPRPACLKVLMQGIVDGVRGAPWCVKGKDGEFHLLSFGTLTAATYLANGKELGLPVGLCWWAGQAAMFLFCWLGMG
jgi:hypothetical protein